MPTVVPFHRTVVSDTAFAPEDDTAFSVHTRWIETEFDNQIQPYEVPVEPSAEEPERQSVVVEVGGKRLEVTLPQLPGAGRTAGGPQPKRKSRTNRGGSAAARGASGDSLTSPMQGTIVKIAVANGDTVAEGDLIVVLEAMKMEQPLTAHKSGAIKDLTTSTGDTVSAGTVLANITD